ncbi:MAG: N-acetyltransferase family protein, partial [Pseudobdellovibrionaceae bacterium]
MDAQSLRLLHEWFGRYNSTGPHRIWVGIRDGKIIGFAFSSRYREGKYFSKTVEASIYLDPNQKSKGLGSALYERLFADLKKWVFSKNMLAKGINRSALYGCRKCFKFCVEIKKSLTSFFAFFSFGIFILYSDLRCFSGAPTLSRPCFSLILQEERMLFSSALER